MIQTNTSTNGSIYLGAERIIEALDGKGHMACCPAHDDKTPSLAISEKEGKVLVHCFAGCSQESVIEALRDIGLWPRYEKKASKFRANGRSYPPYGRDVFIKIVKGEPLNVFVYGGEDCWAEAKKRIAIAGKGSAIVLPPYAKATDYKWPVRDLEIMVVWPFGTYSQITELGTTLVKSGAKLVVAPCLYDSEGCIYFRPRDVQSEVAA